MHIHVCQVNEKEWQLCEVWEGCHVTGTPAATAKLGMSATLALLVSGRQDRQYESGPCADHDRTMVDI